MAGPKPRSGMPSPIVAERGGVVIRADPRCCHRYRSAQSSRLSPVLAGRVVADEGYEALELRQDTARQQRAHVRQQLRHVADDQTLTAASTLQEANIHGPTDTPDTRLLDGVTAPEGLFDLAIPDASASENNADSPPPRPAATPPPPYRPQAPPAHPGHRTPAPFASPNGSPSNARRHACFNRNQQRHPHRRDHPQPFLPAAAQRSAPARPAHATRGAQRPYSRPNRRSRLRVLRGRYGNQYRSG